jgi:tRNA pseudouridine38-40 synthase
MRYALELAYRGTNYHGWQIQPNASSVQAEVEKRLTQLMGGVSTSVVGCGRTDTGVHASYYVLHFDTERNLVCEELAYKLNKMLPADIAVFAVQIVSEEFHARFSATARTYRYFIHHKKDAFRMNSLLLSRPIDFDAMNQASEQLIGTKDFTSFSKLHTDVKTNICTVTAAKWFQNETGWYFEITADRFLRNMVRATVGTLLDVGFGVLKVTDLPIILEAKDRGKAKLSVPAEGLFLTEVVYPEELFSRCSH